MGPAGREKWTALISGAMPLPPSGSAAERGHAACSQWRSVAAEGASPVFRFGANLGEDSDSEYDPPLKPKEQWQSNGPVN